MFAVKCLSCPVRCGADRSETPGACGATDRIEVALAQLHHWEEPPISGARGSGTIFFSHCNLHCRFCQNYGISQQGNGREVAAERLIAIMLELEQQGAHNINLVSPTHYSEQLLPVLEAAKPKLGIPFVWNSNGYELTDTLSRFEGLVTVYLPDLKYSDNTICRTFSQAPDYFRYATDALLEMKRQVGGNRWSDDGTLRRGMIVRHLVLPGQIENSNVALSWIRDMLGPDTLVSLMAQYYPVHRAAELPEMNRRLTRAEYDAVRDHFESLGFEQGFVQELDAASKDYTPTFDERGI
jgi:putative pyruvate formate lyase activating enzyme